MNEIKIVEDSAVNTLGWPITIYYVKLNHETIGEFRNKDLANLFAAAVVDWQKENTVSE